MGTEKPVTADLVWRAAGHAALADPGRLRVVDALVLGDRSPSDLALELGMPSNLMAHHLKVLEAAGLIARLRSESDRRRTYVRLVPSALARIGRMSGPVPPEGRVVFVCTANSARSQLAAAVWADRAGMAASAGTHPADRIHPGAARVARSHRLHLLADAPATVDDVLQPDDFLVTVCDSADREVGRAHVHWSVADPVQVGGAGAFERALAEITGRIDQWLSMQAAAASN
jgi:ArsR family transcriptional regulator, arsenate/arsenite/antimonite-responsive transcriptional repressor / arsenate reductase (thioredoxin)